MVSLLCLKASLPPFLTVQTLSITLFDRLSSSVPVFLNVPVISKSAFLHAPSITVYLTVLFIFPAQVCCLYITFMSLISTNKYIL